MRSVRLMTFISAAACAACAVGAAGDGGDELVCLWARSAPSAVGESRLYEASLALFSDHVINYELNVELKSLELRLSLVPYR